MEKKGLCVSCVNNKACALYKKSAVQECNEFSGYVPVHKEPIKIKKIKKINIEPGDDSFLQD